MADPNEAVESVEVNNNPAMVQTEIVDLEMVDNQLVPDPSQINPGVNSRNQ
jgi:hypothetical protein